MCSWTGQLFTGDVLQLVYYLSSSATTGAFYTGGTGLGWQSIYATALFASNVPLKLAQTGSGSSVGSNVSQSSIDALSARVSTLETSTIPTLNYRISALESAPLPFTNVSLLLLSARVSALESILSGNRSVDSIHYVGDADTGLSTSFSNKFTHVAGSVHLHFWKDVDGMVHIEGHTENPSTTQTTSGTGSYLTAIIFQLPVGYRPFSSASMLYFTAVGSDSFAEVRLNAEGELWIENGNSIWVSLDNIQFKSTTSQ
jgi:hypothetical protein